MPAAAPSGGLSYDELISAVDRAFAVPPDAPLPVELLFGELRAMAGPQPAHPGPNFPDTPEPVAG